LRNGLFSLSRCSGVLPDGLTIQIPEQDLAPEARSVKTFFPPSAESLDVYLGAPVSHAGSLNYNIGNGSGGRAIRYRMEMTQVADETIEGNECEIPVAHKNFQILFAGESLDDKVHIKIAELGRTATGEMTLKDAYIPPAIALSASGSLQAILHRTVEMLAAKSGALSQQRRHIADFGASDIANFWLLHTVNSYLPVLSHLYFVSKHHPEQLYLVLSQLAGELTTFALDTDPRDLPRYDHEDLARTFGDLELRIRSLLDTVIATKYVIIPLEKTPQNWYRGRVNDDRLLKTAQFYLAANAQLPANRLINEIPAKSKISSPDEIDRLIGRALPGVELSHEPVPPSTIPVKPNFKYYHLNTHGRFWDTMCMAKSLAVYLPDEFPDLKVELVAIRE
jgi:type VI secretion system protein ImpJ